MDARRKSSISWSRSGPRARWIADEAVASGMNSADVHPVETNTDAIGILQGLIRSGDVVLIKGSRAAAMESIVDALSRATVDAVQEIARHD